MYHEKALSMYTNCALFKGIKSKGNLNKELPDQNHKTPSTQVLH